MSFNPYAAPAPHPSDDALRHQPAGSQPQPIGSTEVVGAAASHFNRNKGLLIGATLVMGLIRGPAMYAPAALMATRTFLPGSIELHASTLACALVGQVLSGYLGTGFARMGLAIVRGQEPSLGQLFGWKGAGRNIVLALAFGLFSSVASAIRIAGAAAGAPDVQHLATLWMFVALVPLILAALALSQATYFITDQDMSLGDAIRASITVTRGRRGEIFLASLLGYLILLAGALACGIGMLVATPIFLMISPVIYARLTGQDPAWRTNDPTGGGYGAPPGFGGPGPGYGSPPGPGYGSPPGPR